ncbi:MAG: hypothetical protein ABI811_06000 [Acidobacteriota bacterium]
MAKSHDKKSQLSEYPGELEVPVPTYFQIEYPNQRVRFEYAAIENLHEDLRTGGDGVGLLLGSFRPDGLYVQHCELLSFSAEVESDPVLLQGAVHEFLKARSKNPLRGSPELIGLFRTQGSGWPDLTETDSAIVRRYFRAAGAFFLLILAAPHRPWSATLLRLNGQGKPEPDTFEGGFPFDEYLLRKGYLAELVPLPAPPPAMKVRRFPGPFRGQWMAAVLFGVVIASWAGYKWFAPGAGQEKTASFSSQVMQLKASRSGSDFELSWDRFAKPIMRAAQATLTIADGALTRSVPLTPKQLQEGKILYTPLFDEVTFRLEVATEERTTEAEMVKVLAWSGKQAAEPPQGAPPSNPPVPGIRANPVPAVGVAVVPPLQAQPQPRPTTPRGPAPAQTTAVAAAPPQTPAPEALAPLMVKDNESGLRLVPEPLAAGAATVIPPTQARQQPAPEAAIVPATPRPRAEPAAPPPSPNPQVPASNRDTSSPVTSSTGAITPAEGRPAVPPTTLPERPPSTPPTAGGTVAPSPVRSQMVAPVILTRVSPEISRDLRKQITANGAIHVSVHVQLDAAGKLSNATIGTITPGNVQAFPLTAPVISALKSWKFRPATLNGTAVASELMIQFTFQ